MMHDEVSPGRRGGTHLVQRQGGADEEDQEFADAPESAYG
jgi:hypothetical protein